ncbi:MAG: DNA methyltransferase, partial [Chloroflexi bacterium]|nr:DNA methyltransferase [Chloroflexota bacterium]
MNRTLFAADCLDILNDSAVIPDASVDLIYLDPPFNSNSKYNLPFKGKDKNHKPVEAFVDIWKWSDQDAEALDDMQRDPRTRPLATIIKFAQGIELMSGVQGKGTSLASYLLNMATRLRAMRRLLRSTGSIYLHCDSYASHYLKLVMDTVFGISNFKSEIIWHRSRGFKRKTARQFPQKSDTILFYSKSRKEAVFNTQYKPHKPEYIRRFKRDESGRLYRDDVNPTGGGRRTIYLDETVGDIIDSVWNDIPPLNSNARERLGYPTQKPLALLERIIRAPATRRHARSCRSHRRGR